MKIIRSGAAAICVASVLTLAACSSSTGKHESTEIKPAPTAPETGSRDEPEAPQVDWLTHYNGLRQSIESMVAQQDCRALQETFDVWAKAGETDVMEYIDFQLGQLGCYE